MKKVVRILGTMAAAILFAFSSQAQIDFTDKVGGDNGESFMIPSSRKDIFYTEDITGIAIQHGRRVETILVEYVNDSGISKTESAGNNTSSAMKGITNKKMNFEFIQDEKRRNSRSYCEYFPPQYCGGSVSSKVAFYVICFMVEMV